MTAAGGTARSEVIFAASLFLSPRLMELGRGRGKRLAGIRAIFSRDFFPDVKASRVFVRKKCTKINLRQRERTNGSSGQEMFQIRFTGTEGLFDQAVRPEGQSSFGCEGEKIFSSKMVIEVGT